MKEIDHANSTTLATTGSRPAYLPDTAGLRDHIARLRVSSDEIHEGLTLGVVPNPLRLPDKERRLSHGYGRRRHILMVYANGAHSPTKFFNRIPPRAREPVR